MESRWPQSLASALREVGERLIATLPGLGVMLVLVVIGLGLGAVARTLVSRAARAVGFDGLMERWGLAGALRRGGVIRLPSDVLGIVCFWAIFIVFASLGIDALGTHGTTVFQLSFVPPLFAALLILVVGWLVANFLSQGILIAAVNAGLPEARLLARAAHWGVILFAGATALTHLGIGKEMVLVAFGITFGGLVFALALAFGLGGRGIARQLLERRLRRESPPERERLTHL